MYYSFNGKREQSRERAQALSEQFSVVMSVGPEYCPSAFARLSELGVNLDDESNYAAIHIATPVVFDETNDLHIRMLYAFEQAVFGIENCHVLTHGGRLFAMIQQQDAPSEGVALIADLKRRMEAFLENPVAQRARVIIAGADRCRHAVRHCAFQCVSRNEFHDFLTEPPKLVMLSHDLRMLASFGGDLDFYQQISNKLVVSVRSDSFSPEGAARELCSGVIRACADNIIPVQTHIHMLSLILTQTVVDNGLAAAEFARDLIESKMLLSGHTEEEMYRLATEYFTELRRQHLIVSHNLVADRMRQIKEYVEGNITAYDLSVTSISDLFGVNRSLLTSQFKRHYGMSLSRYIQGCRVAKAKSLMETNPGWSMENIARAAGYSSLSTMYRSFKKQDGIAPGGYRG